MEPTLVMTLTIDEQMDSPLFESGDLTLRIGIYTVDRNRDVDFAEKSEKREALQDKASTIGSILQGDGIVLFGEVKKPRNTATDDIVRLDGYEFSGYRVSTDLIFISRLSTEDADEQTFARPD